MAFEGIHFERSLEMRNLRRFARHNIRPRHRDLIRLDI
jgi:hypothetical protein